MARAQQETTAVAGRLCPQLETYIRRAWQKLDEQSAVSRPPPISIPHLSFQLVQGRLDRAGRRALEELAAQLCPLPIQLSGLGLFSEPRSVLYVTVVRSLELERVQRLVTLELARLGYEPHPLYRPEAWVPHISLAFDEPHRQAWDRIFDLEKKGVFHRTCHVDGLIALSVDEDNPVMLEADFSGPREGSRQSDPGR